MPLVARIELLGFKMLPSRSFDYLAGKQIFNETGTVIGHQAAHGSATGSAKLFELLQNIHAVFAVLSPALCSIILRLPEQWFYIRGSAPESFLSRIIRLAAYSA